MKGTFEMPNGMRLRVSSQRRYIVAVYIGGLARWAIQYRTDVESRAVAQWRHEARICEAAALIDTVEGKVIR